MDGIGEGKSLNRRAYSMNISQDHTPKYKGLRLVPSRAAMREMMYYGFTLNDCVKFLVFGYAAPRKRKSDVVEKWFDRRKKTVNIVACRDYNEFLKEECWVIIHIGEFSKKI